MRRGNGLGFRGIREPIDRLAETVLIRYRVPSMVGCGNHLWHRRDRLFRIFVASELIQIADVLMGKVAFHVRVVENAMACTLLQDIPRIDLLLHRSQRNEAINVHRLDLPNTIDSATSKTTFASALREATFCRIVANRFNWKSRPIQITALTCTPPGYRPLGSSWCPAEPSDSLRSESTPVFLRSC